jgi:zinc transporter ZupT
MGFADAARAALVRAFRTLLQALLGVAVAFVAWLGAQSAFSWVEIKVEGSKLLLGLAIAAGAFVVAWLQNVLELWKGDANASYRGV